MALSIDWILFRVSSSISRMSRSGNVLDSLKALVFLAISIFSRGISAASCKEIGEDNLFYIDEILSGCYDRENSGEWYEGAAKT